MEEVRALQAASSSVIQKSWVNPKDDARDERAKATFDVRLMSEFLNDGSGNIKKRQKFAAELEQLPWAKKDKRFFLNREEEYVGGLRVATQVWSKIREKTIDVEEALLLRLMIDFPGGLELHMGMFIPTILGQGTEEQKRELLPKCNSLEIIGTYAQTELGHGTFLRGLETTATFVQSSDQFIIHSPTLTATKWWPGGLGKTSTHAVVMARLFLSGKDYGPHAFIVQLRDLKSHKTLPGIEVGDIGPKFGYNGVDNGFLRFDHVLVPHSAMLSRFAQVSQEGKYIPPPLDNQKAMYSTMLFVRADIVKHSARYLARATTIAVRYCCVRRQTAPSPQEREVQVIDYDNTATTLLPLVATSYVLHAAGKAVWDAYKLYESEKSQGRFGTLPELHASSSGLKALCTECTADGIEAARRACGGHGYSVLSGLPTLFASYVQNVTWEGDNNVLLLQTGRFLLKIAVAVAMQQPNMELPASAAYLKSKAAKTVMVGEQGWIKAVFSALAQHSVRRAVSDIMKHPDSGGKVVFDGPAWNKCTVSVITASRAHILCLMLESYEAMLKSARAAPAANVAVLQQVGDLWGVETILKNMGGVLESGVLQPAEAQKVSDLRRQIQQTLRPNAISLVDSWAFTDYELHSALGREDGDVYSALLNMAKGSPLNKTDEGPAWESVMKPAIEKLQRSKL